MPDQNGPQAGGEQPRDPWAPPERRPSLDKPGGPAGPPSGGSVHEQPTMAAPAPDGGGPAVPPPPPAPGPYGYPNTAPGSAPQGTGPAPGPAYGSQQPSAYGYPQYPGGSGSYPAGPGPYSGGPAPYPGSHWGVQPMPSNGMGTAAMVLGIISVVGFCMYGVVGLIAGILAIIFGIKGRRKADNGQATNRGAATAGLILGWIGAVIGLLVIAFIVVAIVLGVRDSHDNTPLQDGDPFATSLVVDHPAR
ncbi:DUF4190 domain-containing protein [Streptomyces montanisoli]|uniref:DUF4190 domain-containing protein n=1 Tax=Streptomyces montanisoli TaxID=2798581 RepID=A0A940M882_9ACTN|nr:DUF4190 domain-containing protein [Streptomyces montanisoli]MBP0456193.1 DUF4190 domain-containing protein [Streptomyces montanisoli]